jgi:hypothetical protein
MAKPTPATLLRAELEHKRRTLPIFLKPQLGDVLDRLDDWVTSVETRLATLDQLVSA